MFQSTHYKTHTSFPHISLPSSRPPDRIPRLQFDFTRQMMVRGKIAYDAENERVREVEEQDITGQKTYYDRLILHKQVSKYVYTVIQLTNILLFTYMFNFCLFLLSLYIIKYMLKRFALNIQKLYQTMCCIKLSNFITV